MAYSTDIDRKWQKKWEETKLYKFDPNKKGEKLYVLEMFSSLPQRTFTWVTGTTTL